MYKLSPLLHHLQKIEKCYYKPQKPDNLTDYILTV